MNADRTPIEELWDGPEPIQVTVAKGALREVGLGDIADTVYPNRIGAPSSRSEHSPQMVKAFLLGHLAAGHDARMSRGLDRNFVWCDSILCATCNSLTDGRLAGAFTPEVTP